MFMPAFERPLFATGAVMAALGLAFGGGLAIDPRVIDGMPAWLKPTKFAISTAIYSVTLAWILSHLDGWPRLRRAASLTTSVVFLLEVALIALQAARGTSSHFNVATPFDGAVFATMGVAILAQTIVAAAVTRALWVHPTADRAMGWALCLGMTLSVAGASVGGLMTTPTRDQLARAALTHEMPRGGAHTVGGDDGGPGLPLTGWTRDHGDLRVPHFVGLHAMQALPILALLLRRSRLDATRQATTIVVAAASYGAVFLALLVQALAGQPLLGPTPPFLTLLAVWAAATAAAATWAVYLPAASRRSEQVVL